ncbi:hypothetical protein ES707_04170 [subsurface metagenome]
MALMTEKMFRLVFIYVHLFGHSFSQMFSISPGARLYILQDQPLSNGEHLALSGKLPLLKGLREQGFIPRALPMVEL